MATITEVEAKDVKCPFGHQQESKSDYLLCFIGPLVSVCNVCGVVFNPLQSYEYNKNKLDD